MKRRRLREFVKAVKEVRNTVTEEQAALAPSFFREWTPGAEYAVSERVSYDGRVYTVLQAHTAQDDWTPDAAASLFAVILPGQGGTEIGEWVQPDSTNPYAKGDRVTYGGKTWESTIDGNVWAPGVYGWVEVG